MITATHSGSWSDLAVPEATSKWGRYGDWAGVGALVVILGLMQLVSPHHQILHANDPALQFPYVTDETFPIWILIVLSVALPLAIFVAIFIVKLSRAPNFKSYAKFELHRLILSFCFAILLTLVLTDFGKRLAGRPRPNSVAMSGYQPDGSFDAPSHRVNEAFQSFPSGHSSTAFAGLFFLSLYMFHSLFPTSKCEREGASMRPWKLLLCVVPLLLAGWIAVSRLTDYWHHPSDVLAGSILGSLVSRIVFYTQFHCYRHKFSALARKRASSMDPTKPLVGEIMHTMLPNQIPMGQV